MPRFPAAASLVAALLAATPSLLTAQAIAPPRSSPVWNARSSATEADSARRHLTYRGWTQSTGAAAGGIVGVLAGLAVGLFRCRPLETYTGRNCGRDVPRAVALFGGVGLLMGWVAGADAERRGQ